ncbi:MAG: hypothetical protein H6Q96_1068 [Nitrospirae bacterium]|nr:hypothetical protein [Nitrospirota bacterium]
MNIITRSMATAAVLAALSLPVFAQQGHLRGPAGGPPSDEQREEVRKKMEAIKMSRLTEELKLDEKTAAKFIPVICARCAAWWKVPGEAALAREERGPVRAGVRAWAEARNPSIRKARTGTGSIFPIG